METKEKRSRLQDISRRNEEPLVTVTAEDLMPLPPPLDQRGDETALCDLYPRIRRRITSGAWTVFRP